MSDKLRYQQPIDVVPNVPDISDSFYEILLKSFIMYGDTADVTKFNESYQKESSQN